MAWILLGDRMLWILLMKKYDRLEYNRLFPPPEGKLGLSGVSLVDRDQILLKLAGASLSMLNRPGI
jgi:hypothetical protein